MRWSVALVLFAFGCKGATGATNDAYVTGDLAAAFDLAGDGMVPANEDLATAADMAASGSCVGALICEDFESYTVGKAPAGPWATSTNGGAIAVDSTHAKSGTKSVHVTTLGQAAYESAFIGIVGAPTFPVAGNLVYGRMMVWLKAAPTQTTHWTNIQGEGPVPGQSYRAVNRYGGQYSPNLMANYDTQGVASDCWQHSMTAMPTQTWACFEWRFDTPNNRMDFWLNGTSIPALTVIGQGQGCINNGTNGKWNLPNYDAMRVGWEHYQTSNPIDMWIDDVALDVKRIGCPP